MFAQKAHRLKECTHKVVQHILGFDFRMMKLFGTAYKDLLFKKKPYI